MWPSDRRLMRRVLGALLGLLLLAAGPAHAFDLDDLSRQLAEPAVVRGQFVQEKHLRGLPQPLTSRGAFVLARDGGLLWQLREPLQLDYRITAAGIAQRSDGDWRAQPVGTGASRQQQLLLAVLAGDIQALQADFDPQLSGTPEAWTLALSPRGALLKQVFNGIEIQGGELVRQVAVQEAQGDRTVLTLSATTTDADLSDAEQRDLAD